MGGWVSVRPVVTLSYPHSSTRCTCWFPVYSEPPLDPDNLPEDEWLCNRCRGSHPQRQVAPFLGGEITETWQSIADRFLRTNPTSFDLPSRIIRKFKATEVKGPKTWVQDNKCFKCSSGPTGSHVVDRLLKCTACPLVYHLDCLPNPTTHVHAPSKWRCPNHAERILESSSRRKRFRQTPRKIDTEEDVKEIMDDFVDKVQEDREQAAREPPVIKQQKACSEEDKAAFVTAVLGFQHEWFSQNMPSATSAGSSNAYPEVSVSLWRKLAGATCFQPPLRGASCTQREADEVISRLFVWLGRALPGGYRNVWRWTWMLRR